MKKEGKDRSFNKEWVDKVDKSLYRESTQDDIFVEEGGTLDESGGIFHLPPDRKPYIEHSWDVDYIISKF